MATAVSRGQYAFWLGSGISRDRVADLRQVIRRVLVHLHERIDAANPACRYRRALNEALQFAQLSPDERAALDTTRPVGDWPILDTILQRLASNYARLLDVRVAGEPPDYLLWEAVDVVTTFAPAHAEPDCEHLCVGMLAIEGVLPEVATANWDGLIEAGVEELTGGLVEVLRVCVRPDDFRGLRLRTRLLKFHGCAVRARLDPANYRPLIVARLSQITGWPHNPDFAVMRDQLATLAITQPTLMIGLSAQDTNIQDIFAAAQARMQWPWPSVPPAQVFAEDAIGQDQRNVLRCVYRDAYDVNTAAIEASALLRAYAKPLLVALVLYVVCAKLGAFVALAEAPHLSQAEREDIQQGIRLLRNRVGAAADGNRLDFIRSLVRALSRGLAVFREGRPPAADSTVYAAIGLSPLHQIGGDPDLATSGMRECAAAIGLFGLGDMPNGWALDFGRSPNGKDGVLTAGPAGHRARIYFAANTESALQLEIGGIVSDADGDAVVVHSTAHVPRQARSPRVPPGRTGRPSPRHVNMRDLLRESATLADLQHRFREEAAL